MKNHIKGIAGDFDKLRSLEWLETNGLGGYASGTVSGAHSRRYHGLLVAALHPPVERTVVLSKLDETLVIDGSRFDLSANQYPGAVHPQGYNHLHSFERDLFPVFTYRVGNVVLLKTVAAIHGENITVVNYEVVEADGMITMELVPLCASRDYHGTSHANEFLNQWHTFQDGIFRTRNYQDGPELFISVPGATFEPSLQWYYNFEYSIEQYRGLDFKEDLFNHGKFLVQLKKGDQLGVIVSTKNPGSRSAFDLLSSEKERRQELLKPYGTNDALTRLAMAADQFVVKRGENYKTVIAGYHWFSDWGRDTMISLPGLCLATGRYDDAKIIIRAFAESMSEGMLPNRFPDQGETPEYNTVDATLWFFIAIYKYYEYTKDIAFVQETMPVLASVIEWHYKGTRYNIKVDGDELLMAGQAGVQLTWMDAKVGDWVVTPRMGKPVEINALWYNALSVMAYLFSKLNEEGAAHEYKKRALREGANFNELFWSEERGYLYDYVDDNYKNADLRPNQLYAIGLPFQLLNNDRAARVLSVVAKNLLTPKGLRSLDQSHPDYKHVYGGNPWSRDGAYHQGTVWSFLLGPYIDAVMKVKGKDGLPHAKEVLTTALSHLDEACIGYVSEIFDADAPHTPRGCMAQAWGVGEWLRVALEHRLLPTAKRSLKMSKVLLF